MVSGPASLQPPGLCRQQEEEGGETDICKVIDDLILDGEKRGERRGKEQGKKIGMRQGETRLARLIMVLSETQRDDLILKAASDDALRKKLYEEYQI